MSKYSDKLKDPRWQKARLKAMERDNFRCQACGGTDKTLNVHHLAYHGDPWETPTEQLETLCETCHEKREVANSKFKSLKSRYVLDCLSEIIDLNEGSVRELESIASLINAIKGLNSRIGKVGALAKESVPLHKKRDVYTGELFYAVHSAIKGG